MHRNFGALLSLPSVEVLQQNEVAEAVSRKALSLLEGEEHPVIAVSGGQIAPLCLAHILDKMSPERKLTVVLTDERCGVDVSAQNAARLRSITKHQRQQRKAESPRTINIQVPRSMSERIPGTAVTHCNAGVGTLGSRN